MSHLACWISWLVSGLPLPIAFRPPSAQRAKAAAQAAEAAVRATAKAAEAAGAEARRAARAADAQVTKTCACSRSKWSTCAHVLVSGGESQATLRSESSCVHQALGPSLLRLNLTIEPCSLFFVAFSGNYKPRKQAAKNAKEEAAEKAAAAKQQKARAAAESKRRAKDEKARRQWEALRTASEAASAAKAKEAAWQLGVAQRRFLLRNVLLEGAVEVRRHA